MIKRVLASILTLALLLSLTTGWVEREATDPTVPAATEPQTYTVEDLGYDPSTLSIATFTPLTGKFFTNMWGNGSSDADVKNLLHGYPLSKFDMATQNFIINEDAVSGYQITTDRNGNKEYNIILNSDLKYSDGTQITAYDYAFSILFQLHPATGEAGADRPNLDYIVGASDYAAGRSNVLTGVRIMSKTQLKITINKNAFPYYFELSYIAFNPYPISAIAPKASTQDDGKGAFIYGTFNAKQIELNVLHEKYGYLTFPKVVSGPYKLTSFDGKKAEFVKNKYYKGSDAAAFEKIILTSVTADEAASALSSGNVALINKAMSSEAITGLTQLLTSGLYSMSAYPRSGLSFVSFCCEQPTVSDKKVRQAIAMCLDKEALTQATVGNYGTVVDGYYGVGQWMYRLVSGAEEYPAEGGAELGKWQALNFDGVKTYAFDPTAAGELLESAGWKKNSDGIREKKVGGETVKLDLTLVVPGTSSAVTFFAENFAEALKQAGINLTVETMPWADMLKLYYREEARSCDMFYLASNFEADFNPSLWFSHKDSDQGVGNKTGLQSEILYTFARDLVRTDPSDTLGYCTKWVKFLESMSDFMPVIPIYSNIYFDFYTAALNGYEPSANLSWAEGVYGMSLDPVTK